MSLDSRLEVFERAGVLLRTVKPTTERAHTSPHYKAAVMHLLKPDIIPTDLIDISLRRHPQRFQGKFASVIMGVLTEHFIVSDANRTQRLYPEEDLTFTSKILEGTPVDAPKGTVLSVSDIRAKGSFRYKGHEYELTGNEHVVCVTSQDPRSHQIVRFMCSQAVVGDNNVLSEPRLSAEDNDHFPYVDTRQTHVENMLTIIDAATSISQ